MLLPIPFPFLIPFDVLAMPTLAIQHVGSHETESATIADDRRRSATESQGVSHYCDYSIGDDRRSENRRCDRAIRLFACNIVLNLCKIYSKIEIE